MIGVRECLRYLVLMALAAGALAGCAVLEYEPDEIVSPIPPPAPRKPAPKDYGSLWSEDSSWNYVYTLTAARVPGDIVTVQLDDGFKERISKLFRTEEDIENAKAGRNVASETANLKVENTILRGTIEDVGPRGVYRIKVGSLLQMGEREPYIVIRGRVRDRDVNAADEIKVADIVDLSFDLMKSPPAELQPGRRLDEISW